VVVVPDAAIICATAFVASPVGRGGVPVQDCPFTGRESGPTQRLARLIVQPRHVLILASSSDARMIAFTRMFMTNDHAARQTAVHTRRTVAVDKVSGGKVLSGWTASRTNTPQAIKKSATAMPDTGIS